MCTVAFILHLINEGANKLSQITALADGPLYPRCGGHLLSAALAAATQTKWGKRASIGLILCSFLFLSLYYSAEGHGVYLAHPGPRRRGPCARWSPRDKCENLHVLQKEYYRRLITHLILLICSHASDEVRGLLTERGNVYVRLYAF